MYFSTLYISNNSRKYFEQFNSQQGTHNRSSVASLRIITKTLSEFDVHCYHTYE